MNKLDKHSWALAKKHKQIYFHRAESNLYRQTKLPFRANPALANIIIYKL